jgi:hypothetical protein
MLRRVTFCGGFKQVATVEGAVNDSHVLLTRLVDVEGVGPCTELLMAGSHIKTIVGRPAWVLGSDADARPTFATDGVMAPVAFEMNNLGAVRAMQGLPDDDPNNFALMDGDD